LNIVVINGTPRKYGRTRIAAKHVAEKLNAKLVDLSTLELPLFNATFFCSRWRKRRN